MVSSISYLIEGLNYEGCMLAAGLALWLLIMRDQFQARSDPPSVQQGVRTFFAAVLFTLFYGVAGFYLLDRHFSVWGEFDFMAVMFVHPVIPNGRGPKGMTRSASG